MTCTCIKYHHNKCPNFMENEGNKAQRYSNMTNPLTTLIAEKEKEYWDVVIPRMPNVDHTPALDFLRQALRSVAEESIKQTEVGDTFCDRWECGSDRYKECGNDKWHEGLNSALSQAEAKSREWLGKETMG